MMKLPATLTQLQATLLAGKISVSEALQAQRDKLVHSDAAFRCVVHFPHDADGVPPAGGPLTGIGLSHKDIFDTEDRQPGCGHSLGEASPGLKRAAVLQALRQAGAAHLASLSMAEFACGATGQNRHLPQLINPIRPTAVVGGSSSGSAVAVASEMTYGSLGTDTAGSIRIPAATCALVGLKTTHGLLSTEGVYPLARSLDSVGILARSADDTAQLLAAITAAPVSPPRQSPRLKAWIPDIELNATIAQALHDVAYDLGALTVTDQMPEYGPLTALAEIVLVHEASRLHQAALVEGKASPQVQAVALTGLVIPANWHAAALQQRAAKARDFAAAHFSTCDLLMMPALAQPVPDWAQVMAGSPEFDVRQMLALYRYMGFVNYLGFPALVMPIGADERGMPISAQFVARPFQEWMLLEFAARFERQRFGRDGVTQCFSQPRTVV